MMSSAMKDPRFKLLSYKQKCIIERAQEQGYITHKELKFIYSAPQNLKNAVDRLVALKVLKQGSSFAVWEYVYPEIIEKDPQTKLSGDLEVTR